MPHAIAADKTQIHYRTVGEGPRTVVLVHGWMVSGAVWNDFIELVDTTGLKLVVPDLRGAGGTKSEQPASAYSLEQHARDVLAVVQHVGAERFTLIGHSMGGQLAQWIASEVPERVEALALVNSVPASGIPLPPEAVGLFRTSAGSREKQSAILGMACKQLPAGSLEKLLADSAAVSEGSIVGSFDAWTAGGFAERLARIAAPTLVVATDDPFLPPAFLRQAVVQPIRGARMAHLPGPGHYPQVERPHETAALLGAFLADSGR